MENVQEIKNEETVVNYYKSVDGHTFSNINDCRSYERSTKGLLNNAVKNILIHKNSTFNTLNCGSQDEVMTMFKIKTEDEFNIMLLYIDYKSNNCMSHDTLQKLRTIKQKAIDEQLTIVVEIGYDWAIFVGFAEDMIDRINDIINRKEEDNEKDLNNN